MTLLEKDKIIEGLIKENVDSTIAHYLEFLQELDDIAGSTAQHILQMTKCMKFRPILYSTPMAAAILQGRKSVTRRQLDGEPYTKIRTLACRPGEVQRYEYRDKEGYTFQISCPYGQSGDGLWGRETTAPDPENNGFFYRADNLPAGRLPQGLRWTPSIFMPKKATRIFQEVEATFPERLLDMADDDAILEGIESHSAYEKRHAWSCPRLVTVYRNYARSEGWLSSPLDSYFTLWDKINGKDAHSKNPWVWRIATSLIPKPENF